MAIAEARETVREIGRAMRELPHGDQRALRSRAIGSTSDTAAQLGVSAGAARIRVHRARVRLLAQLAA